jgi:hypothetical protein
MKKTYVQLFLESKNNNNNNNNFHGLKINLSNGRIENKKNEQKKEKNNKNKKKINNNENNENNNENNENNNIKPEVIIFTDKIIKGNGNGIDFNKLKDWDENDDNNNNNNNNNDINYNITDESNNNNFQYSLLKKYGGTPPEFKLIKENFDDNYINNNENEININNKMPLWSNKYNLYQLAFNNNNRVKFKSKKNFIIINKDNTNLIECGKKEKNKFSLDFVNPISPFMAFAICISSLITKISC